jgi:nicotinate-nucleotide adenylyltransferase
VARVGLLGGTFNPPHTGHLVCAQEAVSQLGLDRALLVPVHAPPHKELPADPGAEARVAMCRLAVEGNPQLGVSLVDVERPGPSYTFDTLEALAGEDDLTFIVGGDMAWSLPTWREPERILSLARLGVAERDGVLRADILDHLTAALPEAADRIDFFDMPRIDISSSSIRRRVAAGLPIRYLVPDTVAGYVETEGIYR